MGKNPNFFLKQNINVTNICYLTIYYVEISNKSEFENFFFSLASSFNRIIFRSCLGGGGVVKKIFG